MADPPQGFRRSLPSAKGVGRNLRRFPGTLIATGGKLFSIGPGTFLLFDTFEKRAETRRAKWSQTRDCIAYFGRYQYSGGPGRRSGELPRAGLTATLPCQSRPLGAPV